MSAPLPAAAASFTPLQKEYLSGMISGIAARQATPFASFSGGLFTSDAAAGSNIAAEAPEPLFHGTPVSDLCRQELWKYTQHGLDGWERLMEHARSGQMPDDEHNFRFRFFGLFNVSPVQNSLMLRCRLPAGEITAAQLRGLADLADEYGDGLSAITTRSNLQVRQIQARDALDVLMRLSALGLTSRGSGVDNVRNITASPTAGIDPQELIDTRSHAHALHHLILNSRDLFDLPRKFNVSFDGGGLIDTVADTNDIGFMAVTVGQPCAGTMVKDGSAADVEPGIYFRVELCGITGHKQLASDCGLLVRPQDSVALSAAMLRVFSDHGDRTDRKKARLKYLIDNWGVRKFLEAVQEKLAVPLVLVDTAHCTPRPPARKHAHLGIHAQRQPGLSWAGVTIPVGMLSSAQMRGLAALSEQHGGGSMRLTPWQNLLITGVPDASRAPLLRGIAELGLSCGPGIMGGLVACTGSRGCKYAAADTKGDALRTGAWLQERLALDEPVNLHFTGCPHSCAQHYVGDIGFQAVKVERDGQSVDGYHIVVGGGTGAESGIARPVRSSVPADEIPAVTEQLLRSWLARRQPGESFVTFVRGLTDAELPSLLNA